MSLLLARGRARDSYDGVAEASAALVIREYSSSFSLASRLIAEPTRGHVRNIYALVRVGDEIVDIPDARLVRDTRAAMLDGLEADVRQALRTGYSANLVVHAFAGTSRAVGIEYDLIEPFFASMRMDLDPILHTTATFERYIHGSAEVVGLMCLRAFLAAPDARTGLKYDELAPGARRLGAAFQKVNFLRDLAEDHDVLHRDYFPDLDPDAFCDGDRDRILDDIDADLASAATVIPDLPNSSRHAVWAAHATFSKLSSMLRATPAAEIRRRRVRVPSAVKLRVTLDALRRSRA